MKLVFIDQNKDLVKKVKELFDRHNNLIWDCRIELEAKNGDVFKEHAKNGGYICTASNPDFDMAGGLDAAIKTKFPDECISPREFQLTENLLFLVSVDSLRSSCDSIVLRALSYLFLKFNNSDKTFYLTGLGTGIGGLEEDRFVNILANLSRADLSGANLSWADLSWADLSRANLSEANSETRRRRRCRRWRITQSSIHTCKKATRWTPSPPCEPRWQSSQQSRSRWRPSTSHPAGIERLTTGNTIYQLAETCSTPHPSHASG